MKQKNVYYRLYVALKEGCEFGKIYSNFVSLALDQKMADGKTKTITSHRLV
jgi:hypothetical protein